MSIEKCSNQFKNLESYYKSVEQFQALAHGILQFASLSPSRPHFQQEVSQMILDFSGCDEVELWLKGHGKYFRSVVARSSPALLPFDIRLSALNEEGNILPEPDDNPELIRLCNSIVRGQVEPNPKLTGNGSFLVADAKKPLSLRLKTSKKKQLIRINLGGPHATLFLIPLWVNRQTVGLLQLKSNVRNYFKKGETGLYDSLARSIEIAVAHRDAQIDLRERAKELTCLYGIAHLISQPGITLEGIFNEVVRLLPSAWLYPEITCARIVVDGHSYCSPSFEEGKRKQTTDIVVNKFVRGRIEIFYRQERPDLDEGPFMTEEQHFLDAVAKEVSTVITYREAEREKAILENHLRHADRLATIGQLAAGVAHELNEPLGNILGFAQLAQKTAGLPKQVEMDLKKILTASLNAREVVKKLLIFARQMPPRKTEVNLNGLVEEGLRFFESRCAREGIELVCSLSSDLPKIAADPSQVNQALVNLIVNALQAMQSGGRLTMRTIGGKEYVSLIVEDTGIGMDEEVLKRIFTPFFTTKDVGQGTGLGLPVVHGIVIAHGGSIKVESKPHQGSKFEIQLPVADAAGRKTGE